MRIIAIVVLLIGVGVAGGAVYLMFERDKMIAARLAAQQASQPAVEEAPQIETVDIVIANTAMRYGEVLTEKNVRVVAFPKESAPNNGFTSIEDLLADGSAENRRIVLRAIEPNEPILKSKVTGFGERATISAQIAQGMRAFTLRIDTVSGVAGFLLPNDRVDIFLIQGSRDGVTSNVIMQNIKVIAVDQFSDQDSNRARVARTATVEVTPEQAQKLNLAQQVGRISLSLRQIDEVSEVEEPEAVGLNDIIKREEAAAPEPAPRRPCTRKGTELICP